jgi:hypothetical protein
MISLSWIWENLNQKIPKGGTVMRYDDGKNRRQRLDHKVQKTAKAPV